MARPNRYHIPVIPAILLMALIVPVSGAGFFPDGGTFSNPMEITINSTIDAWTEVQPDADSLQSYRWRYNPAAFAIVSGDDHSRNVTFRAIKETKKPEAISYGRRDCSGNSGKDSLCSDSEKASQKYWRIIRISPPAAGLSVATTGASRSASVQFTDLSTGSPSSWSWDFGDGWGSADQNPEHTYEKSGKYTVTLRTANKGGDNSATTTVDVEVPEPAVNAGSPGPDTISRAGSVVANSYPSGTVSVLHFNTNGAVIDDTGRSWVPTSLSYSNSNYKFGGGSALFNGNSWIYTTDDTALSPGSENFTFSAWVYPTSSLSGYGEVWGNWWTNQGGTSLDFAGNVPRIVYDNSGTTRIISGTRALPLNTWSNVVLQGKNAGGLSDVTLYVNGMPNGTITGLYNIRKPTSQTRFYIGRASTAAYFLQTGTYVDDFFMVKGGPAMYEGPFTPPTQEFGTPVVPPQTTFYVFTDGVRFYYDPDNNTHLYPANIIPKEFYTNISGKEGDPPYRSIHWVGLANPVDNETGSQNWNINEDANSMANNADFALHVGHGWNDGILFGTANPDYELWRTNNLSFGGNNGKAKWVALLSCHVLEEGNQENWESVFNGLHILMGFDTVGVLENDQGSQFAKRMTGSGNWPKTNIRESWILTLTDTIQDSSIRGAYMSAYPCKEDYLPGFGFYCNEPLKNGNGEYNISWQNFNCV